MHLVADRFAVDDNRRAIDLATGRAVTLVITTAGGVAEQLRWSARCDVLWRLRHRALAPLVDYGPIGESSRFEAWSSNGAWQGAPAAAVVAFDEVRRVFGAVGLSLGGSPASVRTGNRGEVRLLPDPETGYPSEVSEPIDELSLRQRGMAVIDRAVVAAIAEMFEGPPNHRLHATALWGSRGSGKGLAVRELARLARLRGFVPVTARFVTSRFARLWSDRSLFVIEDGPPQDAWPAILHATLSVSQPHAVLVVGLEEAAGIHGVGLDRIPPDDLVEALRPATLGPRAERTASRVAERSRGLPGAFASLLGIELSNASDSKKSRQSQAVMAAEHPALYGIGGNAGDGVETPALGASPNRGRGWASPGELTMLRRRMDGAMTQIAAGRHAPGMRQLRHCIGALARRDDWTEACRGAIELGWTLLRRGRTREAQNAIENARIYASHSDSSKLLLEVALLSGEAWIDSARLDEAERVLGTELVSARAARDHECAARAGVSLARCLFWRGRYADADVALSAIGDKDAVAIRSRHARQAARIAIGLRDVGRAMTLITGACEQARAIADPALVAAASCTAAFVHLAVGDLDAAARDVDECRTAARAAHDPLRAVRAVLLLCEIERRRGSPSAVAAQVRRLVRIGQTLPPILRARADLAGLVMSGDPNPVGLVQRRAAATGLDALSLLVSAPPRLDLTRTADPIADDIVGVLRACQTAEDEVTVLKDVCALVRAQMRAASVAFVVPNDGRAGILTCDGSRLDIEIGMRALAAGVTLPPHRHDDRIDAAAPVHYGGAFIGALCARWTLGSTEDLSRAPIVLTTSAAAAAPILSAALARREQASAAPSELLGVTPSMNELRSSVERAGAAPFAVLVDGESGSGKELVARAIHRAGPRRDRPFCTLNCAALPDDLVEAELFGHARGAFTGAIADRPGVFEEANGGTLFLDEIGELSPRAQAKILRVIQEGELRRVGENVTRRVDVRIVAATNRDLPAEVVAGRFRLDLLYRLDVVRVRVPPLRERREDIPVLADHFWRESTRRLGSRASLGSATMAALARYDWPGNVRELQNVLAALTVRSPKRGVVPPEALPASFTDVQRRETWRLDEARRTFESRFIRAALVRSGGHRGRAAAELGVTRQGLTKLITRLGIGAE
ncbi:MAG TPA: sigma-54 dependent transcriptional regulator [Vicinamibacterales bacterium]